jgi:hypothetical protein
MRPNHGASKIDDRAARSPQVAEKTHGGRRFDLRWSHAIVRHNIASSTRQDRERLDSQDPAGLLAVRVKSGIATHACALGSCQWMQSTQIAELQAAIEETVASDAAPHPNPVRLALERRREARHGVMYQRSIAARTPRIKCLFKCIQNEICSHRRTDAPTADASGEHVDHEDHVEPALPRRGRGEIRNPVLVWPVCPELPIDRIQRARGRRMGNGRASTFAWFCRSKARGGKVIDMRSTAYIDSS